MNALYSEERAKWRMCTKCRQPRPRIRLHLTNMALAARFNVTEYSIQSFLRQSRRKRQL